MVVPIDSEAPKGRLILPQVQLIRDCLDHGIKSYVVRDTELKSALDDIKI
ncbi:GTP-binding protein [Clostridium sporogenes]|nr:GTP-binding protein [Clostridium sporogenes]